MHCVNELCYVLIISIFNFLIFMHFKNQKTLKPSLAQKLIFMFKFSTTMGQINIPLWTHVRYKGSGKLFNTKKHLAWAIKKNCSFMFLCITNKVKKVMTPPLLHQHPSPFLAKNFIHPLPSDSIFGRSYPLL